MWYLRVIFASFSCNSVEWAGQLQLNLSVGKHYSLAVQKLWKLICVWSVHGRNLQWFITESFSTATNPCQTSIKYCICQSVCSFPLILRAQTNCELFVLTKKDLDEVLTHYPQISKKIRETAEERQRMVAERMKKFAKKKEEDKKCEDENKLKVCWNSWFKDNRAIGQDLKWEKKINVRKCSQCCEQQISTCLISEQGSFAV